MFQLKSGQIKRNLDQIQIVQRDLQTCVQEFQRAKKAYHEVILRTCLIYSYCFDYMCLLDHVTMIWMMMINGTIRHATVIAIFLKYVYCVQ